MESEPSWNSSRDSRNWNMTRECTNIIDNNTEWMLLLTVMNVKESNSRLESREKRFEKF